MKRTQLFSLALVMILSAPLSHVFADQHDSHHAGSTAMTAGEVKKVDKDAGKVTIKHGPIKNLDMPGMTMIFRVKDGRCSIRSRKETRSTSPLTRSMALLR